MDKKTKELIKQRLLEFQELGRRSVRPSVLEYRDWADRAFSLMNYGKRIPWSYEISSTHDTPTPEMGRVTGDYLVIGKSIRS
jgi:hypothetical protein